MDPKKINNTQMRQTSNKSKQHQKNVANKYGRPKFGEMFQPILDQNSESGSDYEIGSYSESGSDSDSGSFSSETDDSNEDNFRDEELQNEDGFDESSDKNGRGEARIAEDWATEGKIHELELDEHNQVIGENAAPFGTYLGIIAKDGNRLPLTYHDWRLVPNAEKERIWEEVQGKTNLPSTYRKICLQRVGKLWRDWKADVKGTHFTPYKHDKTFLAKITPDRVEQDQWPQLVRYWMSKKVQHRSKVNRRSRKKQTMPHRTGRSGFANLRQELKRELGGEPSKLDVFIRSREGKNKKGTSKPLDETTSKMLDMANELKEQLPEIDRNDVRKKDEIYHTLLGPEKPGRLRTYGIGATNTSVTGASSQMPTELTKFFEDSLKDKVTQLFDEMKSEIEKKFLDMMEQRLPELMENYKKFPSNTTLSNDQVHECTSSHSMEKENMGNENICNENDTLPIHDVAENRTSSDGKANEGVDCLPTEDLPGISIGTQVINHVVDNMTSSCAKKNEGVCLPTRELRSKAPGAQGIKNVEVGGKGSQSNYAAEEIEQQRGKRDGRVAYERTYSCYWD